MGAVRTFITIAKKSIASLCFVKILLCIFLADSYVALANYFAHGQQSPGRSLPQGGTLPRAFFFHFIEFISTIVTNKDKVFDC